MKTISIVFAALAVFIMAFVSQEEFVVEANYIGSEEGVYTFVDDNELEYEFSDIDAKASRKYDLDSEKYVGRRFEITYWVDTEVDENDEEYEVYMIVDLDLKD